MDYAQFLQYISVLDLVNAKSTSGAAVYSAMELKTHFDITAG